MRRAIAFASLAGCSLVVPLDDLRSDAQAGDVAADVADVSFDYVVYDAVAPDAGSAYADQVMADAPIAYYRLDESSGTIAHDSSGNHRDCTFAGGVSFGTKGAIAKDPNPATTFDGATAHVDCGTQLAFDGTQQFTVEMWIRPTIDAQYRGIFGRTAIDADSGYGSAGVHGYISSAQPDGGTHITFERIVDVQTHDSAYALGIADATWMHLVSIFDGAGLRIYIDAALGGSATSSVSIPSTTNPFMFAGSEAYTSFKGDVDEVAIYASPLQPSRILAHYNVGIGLPP